MLIQTFLRVAFLSSLATAASGQGRTQDVIYMKAGGTAFTMDVLRPANPNKAAVIFIVSGGWISDHAMLKSYTPDLEKVLVGGGFTVFEVVHGAQPRFKVAEIVEQARTAVRFIHAHAADYGIESNRIGVSGISTGGHLALMIAGSPDALVHSVAAIAPPIDLANWGKPGFVLIDNPHDVFP
jgi:acetyl esterase/lipase